MGNCTRVCYAHETHKDSQNTEPKADLVIETAIKSEEIMVNDKQVSSKTKECEQNFND